MMRHRRVRGFGFFMVSERYGRCNRPRRQRSRSAATARSSPYPFSILHTGPTTVASRAPVHRPLARRGRLLHEAASLCRPEKIASLAPEVVLPAPTIDNGALQRFGKVIPASQLAPSLSNPFEVFSDQCHRRTLPPATNARGGGASL